MAVGADRSAATDRPVNFRDLGGLPTVDGGRTGHGLLYRSDCPLPGDRPPASAVAWPPSTVIDLRFEMEVDNRPVEWDAGVDVHRVPLFGPEVPGSLPPDASLADLYRRALPVASQQIHAACRVVMSATPPVLIHCLAGKDRTGMVVAALLLLGRVRPEAVVEDYARTEASLDALRERARRAAGPAATHSPRGWWTAPREAGWLIIDWFDRRGGPEAWWEGHGGEPVALRTWRQRLTGT